MEVVYRINGRVVAALPPSEDRLKEMLESSRPPRGKTDDTFFQGWKDTGGAQFTHPLVREHHLAEAARAGVSVTGKKYFSELAEFPGDPKAWVGTRGEMVRLVEGRGWEMDGDLKVKGEAVEPAPDVRLADDIVDRLVQDRLRQKYGEATDQAAPAEVERTTADVMDAHAPPAHWDIN